MLQGEAVGIVVALVLGLHVAEGVAEVDSGAVEIVAKGKGREGSEAYSALVDVIVGAGAGIGALATPDIKDAVGTATYHHGVLGDLGIVDVGTKGEFEVEDVGNREAAEDGEVDEDALLDTEDVAGDVLAAAGDADTIVAGEEELTSSSDLAEVEAEQPAPATVVVVAYAHAYLVGELIVHVGVFGNGEGAVGGDGAGRDEALIDEAGPDLCAVLLGTQHAVDSVLVAGATAVEVGLLGIGYEQTGIDGHTKAGEVLLRG